MKAFRLASLARRGGATAGICAASLSLCDRDAGNDNDITIRLITEVPVRQDCKYGIKCYRHNPEHFSEFAHPPSHPDADSGSVASFLASFDIAHTVVRSNAGDVEQAMHSH